MSLPSILGPRFSEHAGSLDVFVSHHDACRLLPDFITNCLGAGRCGDLIYAPDLSSLPADTFPAKHAVLQWGNWKKDSYSNQVPEHHSVKEQRSG